jgi:hypothetical protein
VLALFEPLEGSARKIKSAASSNAVRAMIHEIVTTPIEATIVEDGRSSAKF